MVSIMPGIENLAPERTETSSGLVWEPSSWPLAASRHFTARSTWRSMAGPSRLPFSKKCRHADVARVKPGGTGSRALVISANPAPLPPSSSFLSPRPSALPPPKKYTNFPAGAFACLLFAFFAIVHSLVFGPTTISEKSATVENSFKRWASRARRFSRTASSLAITST